MMKLSYEELLKTATYVLFMEECKLGSTEIASKALDHYRASLSKMEVSLDAHMDPEDLSRAIGSAIAKHVKTCTEKQRFVSGTRGTGWRLGPKGPGLLGQRNGVFAPPRTSQHTGAVGEHAVVSELIACDWNATRLPVDDGVDIFAVKGHETRTVQVKTAHASQATPTQFQFQVDLLAHKKYLGVGYYYVLVLRRREPRRWTNDFIILSSNELDGWRHSGLLQSGQSEKLSLVIRITGNRYLLNGEIDVTDKANDFQGQFR